MKSYSESSKSDKSNFRLGSLVDRYFEVSVGCFRKSFRKISDLVIDGILGVGEIAAHGRSLADRGTLADRSIFAFCRGRSLKGFKGESLINFIHAVGSMRQAFVITLVDLSFAGGLS